MVAASRDIHYELINASRLGSRDAQYQLYKLYNKAMFNVSLRITNHWEEAEDVVQESFVKAFRGLDSFRGDSTFGSWLKRIVINDSLTKVKARKLHFTPMDESLEYLPDDDDEGYDIERALSVANVKAAMNQLSDGYRTVLSLYLLEGYDHGEIAEILDITESTSKTQYKRAKDRLRLILKELNDE
ncbi:MAG: sigma-70 family RNA polymerase sigma factor [Cyclobacteriaceae bacterium]